MNAAVLETEATDARGDLRSALDRAVLLTSGSGLAAAEIHLISDLQASAFEGVGSAVESGPVPVVVFDDGSGDRENAYLDSLMIGAAYLPWRISERGCPYGLAGDADSADVRSVSLSPIEFGGRRRGRGQFGAPANRALRGRLRGRLRGDRSGQSSRRRPEVFRLSGSLGSDARDVRLGSLFLSRRSRFWSTPAAHVWRLRVTPRS